MPGWHSSLPVMWPEPQKTLAPAHWSYREMKAGLDAAGRLIDTSIAERRNLVLINPAEARLATTRTLVVAYQMVLPGEVARSHGIRPMAAHRHRCRARHLYGRRRCRRSDGARRRVADARDVVARTCERGKRTGVLDRYLDLRSCNSSSRCSTKTIRGIRTSEPARSGKRVPA